MVEPWMTAGEFVAWIAERDDAFAAACRDEGFWGVAIRLTAREREGVGPFHTADTARDSGVHALRNYAIGASGYPGDRERTIGTGREDILLRDWADLTLSQPIGSNEFLAQPAAATKGNPIHGSTYWRGLLFDRANVLAVFPRMMLLDTAAAVGGVEAPASTTFLETGTPGRPTAKHLVEAEFRRRAESGVAERSLGAEARALEAYLDGLRKKDERIPSLGAGRIESVIRDEHRKWKLS